MRPIALLLMLVCSQLAAQEEPAPRRPERERTYDVLHYKLILDIDEKARTCSGTATVTLIPLRTQLDVVALDAAGLSVSEARVGWKQAKYQATGESLLIELDHPYGLDDTVTVSVGYSVTAPRKGLYFVRPDSGYPRRQWEVWSQGEPEDNHYWFPCYDYPNDLATSEMIVTVSDHLTAVSNGALLDTRADRAHHTVTYHWLESKPHPSYLISLAAAEYVRVDDRWEDVPLTYYVYPYQKPDAMRSFGVTPQIMEYFSSSIGVKFPWEKYGHAVVDEFFYSGEENVSISTLTDRTIHDARADLDYSSEPLVAHELAHQWFGDLIPFRDWSHAWLSEGFASYFDILYQEHAHGRDAGMKLVRDAQRTVVNADAGGNRRPTVFDRYIQPGDMFDSRIYQKGACVLHMLRFVLGDELFWKSIRHYAGKFSYRNAETNDLKVAIQEATGYNLGWFFDEWLIRAGFPEFRIRSDWDEKTRSVRLNVKQVQKLDSLTGIFRTPVDIEVWVHDSPTVYRVEIGRQEETFTFPAYQEPQCIIFDKGSRLVKKADFEKPLSAWIYQLYHATDAVDRLAAIDEFQWMADSSDVIAAVDSAAFSDPAAPVRRDAVWALGDVKRRDVSARLIAAYGDSDPKTRIAAVTSLSRYRGDAVLGTLRHAFSADSSYMVAAAALRSLAIADSAGRTGYCEQALQRNSYNEVIRSAGLSILADVGDENALRLIQSYTRYGVDRNLRIQAVNILSSVWKSRKEIVAYLQGMLSDPSFHVRRAVMDNLGTIGDAGSLDALQKSAEREADSRLVKAARDAIAKIKQATSER